MSPTAAVAIDLVADILSDSGNFVAVHESKLHRWSICSRSDKCKLKRISSRKAREDAIADLQALDAGTHKSQLQTQKAATKQSSRNVAAPSVVYAAQTREGNYVAGTGRGNKRLSSKITAECESPTKAARSLLKQDCKDASRLQKSLAAMVEYASQLKHKCKLLTSKVASLSRLVAWSSLPNQNDKDTEHKLLREMIGKGYPPDSGRTLRRHRLAVMNSLEAVCGQDKLKQCQVASAIHQMFQQGETSKQKRVSQATDSLIKGIAATFAVIAERSTGDSGKGRHNKHDRIVRDVLTTALMMAIPDDITINSLKAALGDVVDWRALAAGKARAAKYKDGEGSAFEIDETAGNTAYPADWESFVHKCWLECTRESERKSDERLDRKEKRRYRIRWLEQKLGAVLSYMRACGASKFGEGFHLSIGKMLKLMPWYVKRPGRETCMCRYHMEFEHFCEALRRWKQLASKELTVEERGSCSTCPVNAQAMRQHLQCSKGGSFYQAKCSMRHRLRCSCHSKFSSLISDAERAARPQITYQKWSDVPYHCKDGRVLSTHDFMSATVPIAEFEEAFQKCISSFLPHHTRAQVADSEWDYMWSHVHEFPNSVAIITDFSNSYLHKHKYEHMQQFWCEVSTTLLGCVLRIPIDNLKDCFMPGEEKAKLKQLLEDEGLPPLVTITHVMISPNPHHDTSVVQHFWKEKLMPWVWENTQGLEGGNMFVRSDNCGGQFKSARHFRFISEFSSTAFSRGMRLLWSHSEPCHGKDLSDPECGRCKFALEMAEMRHTREKPTEMKTSWEAFQFLQGNCQHTDRDIYEKKGVGIYRRVFHYVSQKEVRPLAKLAEVDTVHGSDSWHMFYDTGHQRHILVREVACFSCDNCKQMKWRQCLRVDMCGHVLTKDVVLTKQARSAPPLTASRVTQDALSLAARVEAGMVLGVECASEQEPYIIVKAASSVYEWQGEEQHTWMGWVRPGDRVVSVSKFEKYGGSDQLWSLTDKQFPIFEEDLRSIVTECVPVVVRQSKRVQAANSQRIEVSRGEISSLEERVMMNLNPASKGRERPRRN